MFTVTDVRPENRRVWRWFLWPPHLSDAGPWICAWACAYNSSAGDGERMGGRERQEREKEEKRQYWETKIEQSRWRVRSRQIYFHLMELRIRMVFCVMYPRLFPQSAFSDQWEKCIWTTEWKTGPSLKKTLNLARGQVTCLMSHAQVTPDAERLCDVPLSEWE